MSAHVLTSISLIQSGSLTHVIRPMQATSAQGNGETAKPEASNPDQPLSKLLGPLGKVNFSGN